MMQGRVVKILSNKYWVKTELGITTYIARGNLKQIGVFVGDIVEVQEETIEKVFPRTNLLIRPPLANLEQLIIIIAPVPKPDLLMLDKMLLFSYTNGISPVICINKKDIADNDFVESMKKAYGNVTEIVVVSAKENLINGLSEKLKNKFSAFVGQSAVGKSALTKALLPSANVEIGELSQRILRGKNTTRHTEIYCIDDNTLLTDTAGFTSLDENLLKINYFELCYYYPDFLPFLDKCKYKSCLHKNENDCAIKTAIENGQIDSNRYKRYLQILDVLQQKWEKNHG